MVTGHGIRTACSCLGGSRHLPGIRLTPADRETLLDHYRRSAAPDVRLRAHILLPLGAGRPWATISAALFCSPSTVSRWKARP